MLLPGARKRRDVADPDPLPDRLTIPGLGGAWSDSREDGLPDPEDPLRYMAGDAESEGADRDSRFEQIRENSRNGAAWSLPPGDPPPLTGIPYPLIGAGHKPYVSSKYELAYDEIYDCLYDPYMFPSMCKIEREKGSSGYMNPTRFQKWFLWAIHENRWVEIGKFRQAYMTTIAVVWMLRDCMYLENCQGALIACDDATALRAFRRIDYAYRNLPKAMQMPLAEGTKGTTRSIRFVHGGGIDIITARSDAPAVGASVDRLVVTEWGEVPWQLEAASHFIPTFFKRPTARFVLESTHGLDGSHHQTIVEEAYEGMEKPTIIATVQHRAHIDQERLTELAARQAALEAADDIPDGVEDDLPPVTGAAFTPLFLEWWKDPSCRAVVPDGFEPEEDELRILKYCEGATYENLAFARLLCKKFFGGDWRYFFAKHPIDPYDGWRGSLSPVMPHDVIRRRLRDAVNDSTAPYVESAGCRIIRMPQPGRVYLITADPPGLGERTNKTDPAGFCVWDRLTWEEIAFWQGQEEADIFARRLFNTSMFFAYRSPTPTNVVYERQALTAVESNAAATIAVLREMGHSNLFWTNTGHPGWYVNGQLLQAAVGNTINFLRDGSLKPRSRGTLKQLGKWDGRLRNQRIKDEKGERHHFERARCVIMAGDILPLRQVPAWARSIDAEEGPRLLPLAGEGPTLEALDAEAPRFTVADLDHMFRNDIRFGSARSVSAGFKVGRSR